jgi:hypothetical protein
MFTLSGSSFRFSWRITSWIIVYGTLRSRSGLSLFKPDAEVAFWVDSLASLVID